jgi:ribonuclease HII
MPIKLSEYYNDWKTHKESFEQKPELQEMKSHMQQESFDDSKQLKEKDRESIFSKIETCQQKGFLTHSTKVISALEISESMQRDNPTNLNELSHQTVVQLIENLQAQGIKIRRVFVDTVGTPEKYEQYLSSKFPNQSKSNL